MAKEMTKIAIKVQKTALENIKADIAAAAVFSNGKNSLARLDEKLNGAISNLKKIGDFTADCGQTAVLYTNGKIAAKRLMLIGMGEKKSASIETVRKAAAKAAFEAVNLKAASLALHIDDCIGDIEKFGQTTAEALHFGGYRYDEFLPADKKAKNLSVIVSSDMPQSKLAEGIKRGSVIGRAQNFARDLANKPGADIYPEKLAKIAKQICASLTGLSCTIFDYKKLLQNKMGGLLAVGGGSVHKPQMIVIKYSPKGKIKNKNAPLALIGKAITFDTGGISLKPSADMHEMKYDMSGGAAVLAAMQIAAKLKLPVEVYGIICAAENKPDGASYLPGDIIRIFGGKTIEVLNTDAEGRLVLADGIEYAKKLKCKTAVDLATLTGACVVALGKYRAGLFGNDETLADKLKAAAKESGEAVWQMPYEKEYADEVRGTISELKNIGSKYGGSCTAAAFLGEFAKGLQWAHLDIAGMMDAAEPVKKYAQAGSIGFGVRLLSSFMGNY